MNVDNFLQQTPEQIQTFITTLSSVFGISSTLLVWIVLGCIVYIIGLLILTQIHQAIVHKTKKNLELYTLAVDTLIYDAQKASANWLFDSSICDWIKNWDAKQTYIESYQNLQNIAKTNFPEREIDLSKSYRAYRAVKGVENILWFILVVVTIWAYKLFW